MKALSLCYVLLAGGLQANSPCNQPFPREHFSSGTPWEPIAGYSRAVRVGPFVYVSGTTATNSEGKIIGLNDAAAQAQQALRNIETALNRAGAKLEDAVRTRIFITNSEDADQICRVHGEFFRNIRPACTLVVVKALIVSDMLVEIECDAIIHDEGQ